MIKFIKKMIHDKKEYKNQMERKEKLPGDYKFVFDKIQEYIWRFASGDGSEMLKVQGDLLDLFEYSALEGKKVLEVTGDDVIGFSDELLRGTKKWTDRYAERLNKEIISKAKEDTK